MIVIKHVTLNIINGVVIAKYDVYLVLLIWMQENGHRESSYTSIPLVRPTWTPWNNTQSRCYFLKVDLTPWLAVKPMNLFTQGQCRWIRNNPTCFSSFDVGWTRGTLIYDTFPLSQENEASIIDQLNLSLRFPSNAFPTSRREDMMIITWKPSSIHAWVWVGGGEQM